MKNDVKKLLTAQFGCWFLNNLLRHAFFCSKNIKIAWLELNSEGKRRKKARKTQKPVVVLFIDEALRVMSCKAH